MSNKPAITVYEKEEFRKKLMLWHTEKNTRHMPWKGETDPYKIWLSEIILQQTRVQQGWQYYQRFTENYPTINDLAKAPDDDVFKFWEGLGYYSRCKNLLTTARFIAFERNGQFPNTYEDILELKGVGPYTAAAIASFAFGLPHAVVDGNVYRVLSRYFGVDTPIDSPKGKLFFSTLANECLDSNQPAAYNQSIMDFGATICTPASPLCSQCPLQVRCIAFQKNLIQQLPVKTKVLQKTTRWFTYFIIENGGQILVQKRMDKDIWQNLHEFYLVTSLQAPEWNNQQAIKVLKEELDMDATITGISSPVRQLLTHQTIFITFIRATFKGNMVVPEGYFLQDLQNIDKLAFPKTLRDTLRQPFSPTLF